LEQNGVIAYGGGGRGPRNGRKRYRRADAWESIPIASQQISNREEERGKEGGTTGERKDKCTRSSGTSSIAKKERNVRSTFGAGGKY